MNISNSQVNRLRHFVRAGLRSLFRPEPQTAVEWADANYYLPKESAYQEGRWETLPFQRAIMNAMGSDYIREVNVVKSARVGYSKMLLGVYAYFIEHKQRNTLIWLPTDGDAENFMKTHVEPTIRDIPLLLALAPWYGKKHRDNTLTMKRFSNGRGFWCLGGKAAKNYREKSVDVAGYDELAAFDEDIEQEGSPTFLGDKRIEGSVWPKSIRGSTPKVRGTCQIERAASESPHFMRFHVACPHCGEEQYPGWMPQKWTWIPRELPGGRASFIHVFEPVEDGQTRGANVFYSVMEQMKMLDTLQNTQLQSAIVKAMYAATIESELDTQSAMDFILGANSQEQRERLTGWIGEIAAYYAAAPVRLGGAKVPHLMPGDSLNLQTAQDTDNGYSVFEQSLLRYISAGLGVSYEQLSRNYAQMSYSTARASANESWAYFMGRRKFVASRQASQMFLCWLEEAIVRRVVTLPSKARFSFQEARSAWGNCDWIGSGRMAIDGLKEVQEAVMLIEAGLSTYEKECAKRGDDYQEIFAQQVRETMERRAAGLKPPAWAAAAFESGLRQSTEEEKSDSRAA
ncbi:TPA: phage portal protein [Escherichia coli]